jgi:hypothetical protein
MLSDSYVLKTTIEQGEQYFNFRGCNIEVNNPVYDDLFNSATFKTYIFFYDSVLVLQEGITEIPDYAFSHASDLGNFILPSTIESIGDYAFAYLHNLYNIIIPEGVISIGHGAFKFSLNLMSVVIPDTVIYWQ